MTAIWLDIARLLERACAGSLTGIDRVELAYAEHLPEGRTRFVVLNRWSSRFALLPTKAVRTFLAALHQTWDTGRVVACRRQAVSLLVGSAIAPAPPDRDAVYLLVSHRHLHREAALASALRGSAAAFVPLIHDLIPLEFPEYARPGEAERHRRRMATVARLADAVVVNSVATGSALRRWLPADRPVFTARLGVAERVCRAFDDTVASPPSSCRRMPASTTSPSPIENVDAGMRRYDGLGPPLGHTDSPLVSIAESAAPGGPYFLTVGTIEPRKNHLLLLHLWRRLIATHGVSAPHLLIAGRRGWENENIVDLLDRCEALRSHVHELGPIPDRQLTALTRNARAVLMPSFAEGFGLPVAEALASGTPVLCSDLPAHWEAGGAVPEYLDPLDTPAWLTAILDYAGDNSARRAAQLRRLPSWKVTTWDEHVGGVVGFLNRVAPAASRFTSIERQPDVVFSQ